MLQEEEIVHASRFVTFMADVYIRLYYLHSCNTIDNSKTSFELALTKNRLELEYLLAIIYYS